MSLANEKWASGNYGGDYTVQQFFETMHFLVDNHIELPSPFNMIGELYEGVSFKEVMSEGMKQYAQLQPDEDIAIWPELVHNWLKKLFR